jgi:ribosomal protein L37AE/L43A
LGLHFYFQQHPLANPIIERSLIILVIGLVAGFATRIILRKWHFFWRILLPLISVGLAIFFLDKFYPEFYTSVFVDRTPWSEPIIIDLMQIGLGYVMGLLALFIGMRRRPNARIVRPKPKSKSRTKTKPVTKSAQKLILFKTKQVDRKKKLTRKLTKKPVLSRSLFSRKATSMFATRTRRFRRKDVKLLGETEHRCPYCLELVKKNDVRGVMICPECKTWHHKDCWDVTGSCQVAHRHDL